MSTNDLMKSHISCAKTLLPFPRKSSALWMKNQSSTTKGMIANILFLAQSPVFVLPVVLSSAGTVILMIADGCAPTTNQTDVPELTLRLTFVMAV